MLKDYTLVGVFNTHYFRVLANCSRPQIWISGTKEGFLKYYCQELVEGVSISSFAVLTNLEKELDALEQFKSCDYYNNGQKDELSFPSGFPNGLKFHLK